MKPESRFYIVKTARQTREKIEDRLKKVNEKYVQKQFETGREFIDELKADPIKKIDDLIDDGKEAVKKNREKRVDAVKQTVKKTRTTVKKRLDNMKTGRTKVVKGIQNDARLIAREALAMGKKNLNRIPFKKDLEEKISKGMASIPSRLNLPSRDEVDNLVNGIDGVNKKVDALNKQTVLYR